MHRADNQRLVAIAGMCALRRQENQNNPKENLTLNRVLFTIMLFAQSISAFAATAIDIEKVER
ncbi:hypothetical protein PSY25_23135, partial [Shigella flexneri]|nr:hypothetical protein [Shigella flexneri]